MENTAAICSERDGQLSPRAARPALCRETKIKKLRLRNVAVFLGQLLAALEGPTGRVLADLLPVGRCLHDIEQRFIRKPKVFQ